MSDGPHKSLPLRPHWRTYAQRAAIAAYAADDVREALTFALKRDILQAPLRTIRDIMGSDTLFPSIRIEKLEALRSRHPGSAPAQLAIDCAVAAAGRGLSGDAGTYVAVSMALEDTGRSAMRSIEEHYQREAHPRSSRYVRERQQAARQQFDCGALAREILSSDRPPQRRSVNLPVRKDVDDGPPL
ncbi:hypothetical protein [Microvirga splendida]|uniref:Uncharacterized protein n=1 Tax=Microvirga splendida TaxID=2795727 RepID=A0ABS0Y3L5_9HYPH|nr:hypothetical protein [Microvirga splendida]MBJ6126887.1 hypothetical protein [Microvirga splendida]